MCPGFNCITETACTFSSAVASYKREEKQSPKPGVLQLRAVYLFLKLLAPICQCQTTLHYSRVSSLYPLMKAPGPLQQQPLGQKHVGTTITKCPSRAFWQEFEHLSKARFEANTWSRPKCFARSESSCCRIASPLFYPLILSLHRKIGCKCSLLWIQACSPAQIHLTKSQQFLFITSRKRMEQKDWNFLILLVPEVWN